MLMTPFLSFIVFLVTLVFFLIGLINAIRKYRNPGIKLRWILFPLVLSLITLIINLKSEHNEWNVQNLISELNPQKQDSLEIKNNSLGDTQIQKENKRKVVKKKERNGSESLGDTSITSGEQLDQTDQLLPHRVITPEQRNKFVNFLKDEPRGDFKIMYVSGDAEAFEYSKRISGLLIDAGYSPLGGISHFAGNDAVEGISIVVNRKETQPGYARSIFNAFRSIGINIVAESNKQLVKPLEVLISVGHQK